MTPAKQALYQTKLNSLILPKTGIFCSDGNANSATISS